MQAKILEGYISISHCYTYQGTTFVELPCNDFREFKKLPNAIEIHGRILAKTGWNSDRFKAYYRSDAVSSLGSIVKK